PSWSRSSSSPSSSSSTSSSGTSAATSTATTGSDVTGHAPRARPRESAWTSAPTRGSRPRHARAPRDDVTPRPPPTRSSTMKP
ncbi:hypothetical protein HispidOSU_001180, partial [Sigmodon hispidus]